MNYKLRDKWKSIPADYYTSAPASTSTLTFGTDVTSFVLTGMGLRYTIGGVVYYGRASTITSILLTVNGAPLSGAVTNLQVGGDITQLVLPVNGLYEDASSTTLLLTDNKTPLIWKKEKAYAVAYQVWSRIHDSGGTHGQASVRINDVELNTTAGGLTIAADATWYSTIVDIATAAYDINPGETIEVTAVKGTTGDAQDLCVTLILVTP